LEKRPFLLGREFENLFKAEPELMRPIYLKLYATDETYKTAKFPVEIKPEGVKAILKNGILEITLLKAEVVKKVKIEVKPLYPSHINQTETAVCSVPEAACRGRPPLSLR
jgi:hypothetical protein